MSLKRLGPLIIYHWGWDLKLPLGWWLVGSRSEYRSRRLVIYVSNDATPPDNPRVRGMFLWGRG